MQQNHNMWKKNENTVYLNLIKSTLYKHIH